MASNDNERDDNPFLSALREERALELERDSISAEIAILSEELHKARADGDSIRIAELKKKQSEFEKRRLSHYHKWNK